MPCGTYHDQRDNDVQRDQSSAFVGKHNGQLLSVHDVCPWSLGRKSGVEDEHIFTATRKRERWPMSPGGLELNPFIYLGVTDLAAAEIRATEVIGTLTLSLEP